MWSNLQRNGNKKQKLLPVPSIALGSVDVRPIDMASSFGTIANEGRYIEPTGILKIEKSGAESDYFAHSSSSEQVISPQAAWIMTQLLKAPISPGGTASSLGIPGLYAAGKTGTTENYKDGWFVGYTKGISIAVYVGSDSREVDLSYIRNYGSEYAGKIWKNVMQTLYNATFPVKLENTNWMKPEGIVTIRVCNETGLRANETCPYHLETRINGMYPSYCQKNILLLLKIMKRILMKKKIQINLKRKVKRKKMKEKKRVKILVVMCLLNRTMVKVGILGIPIRNHLTRFASLL